MVCAISALKVKNGFLAYFALAAAKAKRRYPLLDPFQDSDVGKSGEYSDVAILQPKSNSLRIPPPPRWHPRRIMRSMSNSRRLFTALVAVVLCAHLLPIMKLKIPPAAADLRGVPFTDADAAVDGRLSKSAHQPGT